MGKVRHVVVLKFKEGFYENQDERDLIIRATNEFFIKIQREDAGAERIACGFDLCLVEGNAHYAINVDFASAESYLNYANHPAHLDFLATYCKDKVETRTAVQFPLGSEDKLFNSVQNVA